MRRTLCCAVVVGAFSASLQAAPQTPTGSSPRSATDLERLTVPAAALPANCHLRPTTGRGMLAGAFRTNPAVVTDAKILGFMHILVLGMMPGEAAVTGRGGQADAQKFDEIIAARSAEVEAGYAAAYQEQDGSPEIGVYALRMKKLPAAAELNAGLTPGQRRIIKGPVAIFYWSDARADAPDRGCFDVVRRHIEAVDFR